jgi:hypothetical protein
MWARIRSEDSNPYDHTNQALPNDYVFEEPEGQTALAGRCISVEEPRGRNDYAALEW